MKIVVVHLQDVVSYPPVISLLDNLINNNHQVTIIGMNVNYLPIRIKKSEYVKLINVEEFEKNTILQAISEKISIKKKVTAYIKEEMKDADYLWTTTDFTLRWLGDLVLKYKHVMQLMELIEYYPMYPRFRHLHGWRFPIEKYAKAAWRVVVPEENRAYITKTWWNLDTLPTVLPNKPYYTDYDEDYNDSNIIKMRNENRKIVLYSGVLGFDRDLEPFAKALEKMGDNFALYVLANIPEDYRSRFEKLQHQYSCIEYVGYHRAPNHLAFFSNAYIGLLPYKPGNTKNVVTHISGLNALYCAPNKIYEYAGMGLPMIGTNVLGLKHPFEKYQIGVCVDEISEKCLFKAINEVDLRYDEMSANCKKFYNSVDLDGIVHDIIKIK